MRRTHEYEPTKEEGVREEAYAMKRRTRRSHTRRRIDDPSLSMEFPAAADHSLPLTYSAFGDLSLSYPVLSLFVPSDEDEERIWNPSGIVMVVGYRRGHRRAHQRVKALREQQQRRRSVRLGLFGRFYRGADA